MGKFQGINVTLFHLRDSMVLSRVHERLCTTAEKKLMIKPQSTFLRKLMNFTGKGLLVLVILTCILVAYADLKMKWTKKQVEAFSQLVVIGQPIAGFESKAKEMHLYYRQMSDSNGKDGRFFVWEGFVFDRWFCDVEYKDGKVTKKSVTFLD